MNGPVTIVPSGTYTASPANVTANGASVTTFLSPRERGMHLIINISSLNAGTPQITVTIKGVDPLSGKTYTILASAALASVATTILKVYPALTAASNTVANDILPANWQINVSHNDTQPITYSIGAQLVI